MSLTTTCAKESQTYYTVEEAARLLNLPPRTVRWRIRRGTMAAYSTGERKGNGMVWRILSLEPTERPMPEIWQAYRKGLPLSSRQKQMRRLQAAGDFGAALRLAHRCYTQTRRELEKSGGDPEGIAFWEAAAEEVRRALKLLTDHPDAAPSTLASALSASGLQIWADALTSEDWSQLVW